MNIDFGIAESGAAQDAGKQVYYLPTEKKWGGSGCPRLPYSYGHEMLSFPNTLDACKCVDGR